MLLRVLLYFYFWQLSDTQTIVLLYHLCFTVILTAIYLPSLWVEAGFFDFWVHTYTQAHIISEQFNWFICHITSTIMSLFVAESSDASSSQLTLSPAKTHFNNTSLFVQHHYYSGHEPAGGWGRRGPTLHTVQRAIHPFNHHENIACLTQREFKIISTYHFLRP